MKLSVAIIQDAYEKMASLLEGVGIFSVRLIRIPIELSKTKSVRAKVSYSRYLKTQKLTFSTYIDWTWEHFINVLAHELIHVYLNQLGFISHGHGHLFTKLMTQINLTLDLKLSVTCQEFVDVIHPLKNPIYIAYNKDKGLYGVYRSREGVGESYFTDCYGSLEIFETTNSAFKQFVVQRKLTKIYHVGSEIEQFEKALTINTNRLI